MGCFKMLMTLPGSPAAGHGLDHHELNSSNDYSELVHFNSIACTSSQSSRQVSPSVRRHNRRTLAQHGGAGNREDESLPAAGGLLFCFALDTLPV
jgi:hypothetical protein